MLLRRHVRLWGFVVVVHHQSNLDSAQTPTFEIRWEGQKSLKGRTKVFTSLPGLYKIMERWSQHLFGVGLSSNLIFVEGVAIFNICTLDRSFPGWKADSDGINVIIIIRIIMIIIIMIIKIIIIILMMMMKMIWMMMILIILKIK